eukprot:gene31424-6599_t
MGRGYDVSDFSCLAFFVSPSSKEFLKHVRSGETGEVSQLLKQDISRVLSTDAHGMTAWQLAAEHGHLEVLKELDSMVCSAPDAYVRLNSTMSMVLSRGLDGDALVVKYMSSEAKGSLSPLMLAAKHGHSEVLEYMLQRSESAAWFYWSALEVGIWGLDEQGRTALHHAVQWGHAACCSVLLREAPLPTAKVVKKNIRLTKDTRYVDAPDVLGWVPLHYAAYKGNMAVVAVLLSSGADYVTRTIAPSYRHPDMDSGDSSLPSGVTALHLAARTSNLELVKLILRAHYEASADLIPSVTAMQTAADRNRRRRTSADLILSVTAMQTAADRNRRRRSHPDPRLVVTRTNQLAYHIALHRVSPSPILLEWLDPTVSLMFLFSGEGGTRGGALLLGEDSYQAVATVPRLVLLAAKALHQLLQTQLNEAAAPPEPQRSLSKLFKGLITPSRSEPQVLEVTVLARLGVSLPSNPEANGGVASLSCNRVAAARASRAPPPRLLRRSASS